MASPQPRRAIAGLREVRSELGLLLRSEQFARSERQSALLKYLCERYIEGRGGELTEHGIALDVCHRKPDYSATEDSIVRVQIHELRRRLREYYADEGRDRPIRIEIPRGSYCPEFVRVQSPAQDGAAAHPRSNATAGSFAIAADLRFWRYLIPILLLVSVCANAWFLISRPSIRAAAPGGEVPLKRYYKDYIELFGTSDAKPRETLLSLSNPKILLVEEREAPFPPSFVEKQTLPVARSMGQMLGIAKPSSPGRPPHFYLHPTSDEYTGMGEAVCAHRLGRLMQDLNVKTRLTQARFLSWDRALEDNLIVLGLPQTSLWTRENVGPRLFRNTEDGLQLKNQQTVYLTSYDRQTGQIVSDYGVISKQTATSGSWVLILAGSSSFGTYGVGEFFSDREKMGPIFQKLRSLTKAHGLPGNFVVLLKMKVVENIPTEVSLVDCLADDAR